MDAMESQGEEWRADGTSLFVRFDETLKELLQSTHARLLENLAGSAIRRWLNVEFPRTQLRRVDLLAELENGELFHLELQTRNDGNIGRRLLEYRLLIEEQFARSPVQVVLYLGWEAMRMNGVWEGRGLRFEFAMLDIRDLDPRVLEASGRIEDRILMVLLGREDARERAIAVLEEISRLPHPQRGDALAKLLVTSGLRRLHDDLRQEMTHMPLLDDLMENPFLQDWYREGKEKGRAEGREEGRGVEAARLICQILEHRFGSLPAWAAERLASLPADRLESMIAQVLEASTLEEALRI